METENILQEIASLPLEAQREVVDFVAFLKNRYPLKHSDKNPRALPLADESFIGMWRGREDMQDSTTWVRNVRKGDWGPKA